MHQPDLPIFDPTEPRILPQDGRAWFTINWPSKGGRLTKARAFEADEMPTILPMLAGQPDVYLSQCFFDRPMRRSAFVQYGTHAYVDLDTYRIPHLAGFSRDDQVREFRRVCDDTGTPLPSAIIGSGRGVYGKWYWSAPIGRDGVGDVVAVNRALVGRLECLGADPKAVDPARILRVTGSEHTGARRIVDVLHLEQRDGHTITYDADAFMRGIVPRASEAPEGELVLRQVGDLDREARRERGRRMFTREGWHWAIVEDCYMLARLRWPGGIVPEGSRDIFGHVIACQLARIFPPMTLYWEIVAAVSLILPADYVASDLRRHCSTLLDYSREAFAGRNWTQTYRYKKSSLMQMLEIGPAEERQMRALISDPESDRRKLAAQTDARRAAGMVERAEYEARAASRRPMVAAMRGRGMTWRAIAAELGIHESEARRLAK